MHEFLVAIVLPERVLASFAMVVMTFETISYVSSEMQWVNWGPDVQFWGMSNTRRSYKIDFDFDFEARAWAWRKVDMLPRDAWHNFSLFSSISISLSLSLSRERERERERDLPIA